MESNYMFKHPRHSQPSSTITTTRMTPSFHFNTAFTAKKSWEHPADVKHQEENQKAYCSFNGASSSSPFSSYKPRLLDQQRQFPQPQHDDLKSSPSLPPLIITRAPSFHPIPDADATAIPIDLSRGISDYNLMGPFCWSNHDDDADGAPFSVPNSSTRVIIAKHQHLNHLVPSRDQHQQEEHEAKNDRLHPVNVAATPPLTNNLPQEPTYWRVPDRNCDGASQHQRTNDDKHEQREKTIAISASDTPSSSSQNKQKSTLIVRSSPTKSKPTTIMFEQQQVDISIKEDNTPVVPEHEACPNNNTADTRNVSLSAASPRFGLHHVKHWTCMFKEAAEFRRRAGHCVIPHSYPPDQQLARWAKRQRHQYKLLIRGVHTTKHGQCSMTKERIQALNSVDFCWDIQKGIWQGRYEELQRFQELNGHVKVPRTTTGVNHKLHLWAKNQRHQYKLFQIGKYSNMTLDRIEMLNKLEFPWQVA